MPGARAADAQRQGIGPLAAEVGADLGTHCTITISVCGGNESPMETSEPQSSSTSWQRARVSQHTSHATRPAETGTQGTSVESSPQYSESYHPIRLYPQQVKQIDSSSLKTQKLSLVQSAIPALSCTISLQGSNHSPGPRSSRKWALALDVVGLAKRQPPSLILRTSIL